MELENTRMATEIQFLRDQLLDKNFTIRSWFMSKSVNRDNDDFSYNSRNVKNPVDNVNKNVTPSSPHKSINTNKSINDSNINVTIIPLLLQIFLTEIMKENLLKVLH